MMTRALPPPACKEPPVMTVPVAAGVTRMPPASRSLLPVKVSVVLGLLNATTPVVPLADVLRVIRVWLVALQEGIGVGIGREPDDLAAADGGEGAAAVDGRVGRSVVVDEHSRSVGGRRRGNAAAGRQRKIDRAAGVARDGAEAHADRAAAAAHGLQRGGPGVDRQAVELLAVCRAGVALDRQGGAAQRQGGTVGGVVDDVVHRRLRNRAEDSVVDSGRPSVGVAACQYERAGIDNRATGVVLSR